MRARLVIVPVLLAAALVTAPAAGDWLVLSDGGAIETEGKWTLEGRLIVFHRAGGALTSLRADMVDLEASELRTKAAKAPKPALKERVKAEVKAVLVLTDADVAHVDPRTFTGAPQPTESSEGVEVVPDPEGAEPGGTTQATSAEPELGVTGWSPVDDLDFTGVKIGGTLRNDSGEFVLNPTLTVRLTDENGGIIGRSRATLAKKGLEPEASTSFEAEFSGVYEYAGVEFEPRGFSAVRRSAPVENAEPEVPEE